MPAACPSEPPGIASQPSARAMVESGISPTASGIQVASFRSSSTISAIPTSDATLRAKGSVSGIRGRRPDNRSSAGSASVHHAASAWSGAPGNSDDGDFSDAADRGGPARLQRDAVREDLAALRQRGDAGIAAADAAAADGDEQIAAFGHERARRPIPHRAPRLQPKQLPRRRRARFPRSAAPLSVSPEVAGMLTMRSRGRRTRSRCSPPARATSASSAPDRLPGRNKTSRRDIAADPPNPLPRDRLRQHLHQRARQIDGIGIDHAIAAGGNGVAGLDPERRLGQRQRRVGGGTDEIAGAASPNRRRRRHRTAGSRRARASRPRCSRALP